MRDVEPLVALQADQSRRCRLGKCFGRLGLADTRLTLEEQWLLECEREVERGREPPLGQVLRAPEACLQLVDRRERHTLTITATRRAGRPLLRPSRAR